MNSIYDYVYHLSEVLGERLSATRHEKKAVDWILNKLESFPIRSHIESFKTSSSIYNIFQVIFLFWLFISFFYLKFYYILKLVFLIIELILIILFYKEFNFQHTFVYKLFKTKKSQNVIAAISASKERKRTIYIAAHVDTATAGILFHPLIIRFLSILIKIAFGTFFILFFISLTSFFREGRAVSIIFNGLGVFYFLCFIVSIYTEYFAKPSSGANDNASSVGELLALIEYFSAHPLKNTKIVGLFTGAKEAGCVGIYEFLKKHKNEINKDACFIVLDCTGIGNPVYLKSEGILKKYKSDPELLQTVEKVGQELDYNVKPFDLSVGFTEMQVINNFKHKSIVIGAVHAGENTFPNWHQRRDRIIFIKPDTLKKVFKFVKNIIKTIDEKT